MNYQWMGALMVILGCGGFGFSLATSYILEERSLRQLAGAMDYMACELQYSAAELPVICAALGRECSGGVGRVFRALGDELDNCTGSDVSVCMESAIASGGQVPELTRKHFRLLGAAMGKFDLPGQLTALEALRSGCRRELEEMARCRTFRVREYQTLGVCAGAALAIMLI